MKEEMFSMLCLSRMITWISDLLSVHCVLCLSRMITLISDLLTVHDTLIITMSFTVATLKCSFHLQILQNYYVDLLIDSLNITHLWIIFI